MATNLSGSLSEFGLAEVLSLLSMGGRTARTRITHPGGVGTVHLVDGQISSATDDVSRAVLLRALVAATPVTPEDLAAAVAGADPVRTLVESAAVDRDLAQHVAGEQCAEAIGQMLRWVEGHFEVQVGEPDPGDIGVRIETQGLTDSAEARNRQWQEVRGALPATGSVLTLAPDIAEQPVIDTADWAVLARVDGHRTLEEVLAATGASPLTAGRRLVGLLGRGLVQVQVVGRVEAQQRSDVLLESYEAGLAGGHVQSAPVAGFEPVQAGPHEPAATISHEPAPAISYETPSPTDPYPADPYPAASGELVQAGARAAALEPVPGMAAEAPTGQQAAPVVEFVDPRTPTPQGTGVAPDADVDVWTPSWADTPDVAAWAAPAPAAAEGVDGWTTGQPGAQHVTVSTVQPGAPTPEPDPAEEAQVQLADPVASLDEAGTQFAWSPWAQEMGLGEGPATTATAEATGGASAGGYAADTDAMPHPQAPIGSEPARTESAVTSAGPAGLGPEPTQTSAGPEEDPLAEGLLAQLMSSVRGM